MGIYDVAEASGSYEVSINFPAPMCAGTAVIAGGPGGAARARTGRNGAISHDRPVRVFNGIVQHLVPFHPVKAHIMMPSEGCPAGGGGVRYCYRTQTSCSSRRYMDDPTLV